MTHSCGGAERALACGGRGRCPPPNAAARLAFCIVFACASARAEAPVASSAERLFDDARAAMLARRYDEACAKFAESQRLDPASGTLLNLAVCHEAQGRTATAWTEYKAAVAMSRSDGNAEREHIANARMQALEPSLCHVTLIPPQSPDPDLSITLDGAVVDRTNWGIPMPVDP